MLKKFKTLCCTGLLIISTLGGVAEATPVASHTLIVIENSATSLSVIWDGSTVLATSIGQDVWIFLLPDSVLSGSASWLEPDGSGTMNSISANGTNRLLVMSDNAGNGGNVFSDGAVVGYVDGSDRLGISASFLDREPGTNVPEPESLALFGLALAGLAVVRRRKI